jgi:hypothetical protein
MTDQELKTQLDAREKRKGKLAKYYFKTMAEALPDDFFVKENMTEEKFKEVFEPVANKIYAFMKEEGMAANDVDLNQVFNVCEMNTLQRISNFSAALLRNAFQAKFGYEEPTNDMPMQELQDIGLIVVDTEKV